MYISIIFICFTFKILREQRKNVWNNFKREDTWVLCGLRQNNYAAVFNHI